MTDRQAKKRSLRILSRWQSLSATISWLQDEMEWISAPGAEEADLRHSRVFRGYWQDIRAAQAAVERHYRRRFGRDRRAAMWGFDPARNDAVPRFDERGSFTGWTVVPKPVARRRHRRNHDGSPAD